MTTQLRTKLAKRLQTEMISTHGLSTDHATLLAQGIDAGVMKAAQARTIAILSTDWSDAAVIDASETLRETVEQTKNPGYVSATDNVLIDSMKAMHGLEESAEDKANPLLASMKAMHGIQ